MLKRVFWLALIVAGGWLLWRWWQRQQEGFGMQTPYLAPLEPYVRPTPPLPAHTPPVPASAPPVLPSTPPVPASAPPVLPSTPSVPASAPPVLPSTPSVPVSAPEPTADAAPATTDTQQEPAATQGAGATEATSNDSGTFIAYCPRCKTKRPVSHVHKEMTESGRHAARGTCPVCGAKIFTFLPNE